LLNSLFQGCVGILNDFKKGIINITRPTLAKLECGRGVHGGAKGRTKAGSADSAAAVTTSSTGR